MTTSLVSIAGRFASPALLALGPPPDLASQPFETLLAAVKAKFVVDMAAIGIAYDVAALETDPAVILAEAAVYRDLLRRREIDDAVKETYLGSATGEWLDRRAADYGVLRRTMPHTIDLPAPANRPPEVPPAWIWDATAALWREDDASLLLRARLAWEALSVAGPPGAYAFHAADAHPGIDGTGTLVIGPETGLVNPGQVLLVLQSNIGIGTPTPEMLDAVAARLDAYTTVYSDGTSSFGLVRDQQSVRPLGAQVTVQGCTMLPVDVTATIYVSPQGDPATIQLAAADRLAAYFAQVHKIGASIRQSGLMAALSVTGTDGLPTVDEVVITAPAEDVVPTYSQLTTPGSIAITATVR